MKIHGHDAVPGGYVIGQDIASRSKIAEIIARIAGEAGLLLLRWREKGVVMQVKPDGSPVSEADLAAEALIRIRLKENFGDVPVVGEEGEGKRLANPAAPFFLVDPLDGTRGYLKGKPDFAVLIALIRDFEPIVGAIDAPALGLTVYAGQQAFCKEGDGPFRQLDPNPVSREGERIAMISSHHLDQATRRLCSDHGVTRTIPESSAVKFIRLARGEADLYPRANRTMQWDIASGDAILRALGGGLRTLAGEPIRYAEGDGGWESPGFIAYRALPDEKNRKSGA